MARDNLRIVYLAIEVAFVVLAVAACAILVDWNALSRLSTVAGSAILQKVKPERVVEQFAQQYKEIGGNTLPPAIRATMAKMPSTTGPSYTFPYYGLRPFSDDDRAALSNYVKALGQAYDALPANERARKRKVDITLTDAWNNMRDGNYQDAMAAFNAAFLVDPNNAQIPHGFALALPRITGLNIKLIAFTDNLYQLAETMPNQTIYFYRDWGLLKRRIGRSDEAKALLLKNLELRPNDPLIVLLIAETDIWQGKHAIGCTQLAEMRTVPADLRRQYQELKTKARCAG